MSSLKKIFWVGLTGLIFLFVVWIVTELAKLIYRFVEPIRGPFFGIFHFKIFGIELFVTLLIILFFGLLIMLLSRLKSGIPVVSQFFKLTKTVYEVRRKIEKGKIKVVLARDNNSYFLGFTTGVKENIDGQKLIIVFRPFTPNITAGFTYFFSKKDFKKFPQINGRLAVKLLLHGWLSQTKKS